MLFYNKNIPIVCKYQNDSLQLLNPFFAYSKRGQFSKTMKTVFNSCEPYPLFIELINQFIANTSYIHNTNMGVFRQFMAKFGNEDMQTFGIKEAIISP